MKRKFQYIFILFTVVLMSSCLKDDTIIGPDSPNSKGAIIEWDNPDYIAAGSLTASVKLARYVVSQTAQPLTLRVNYSGTGKGAPNDVIVNIGVDPAALTLHNTQASRSYTLMPATWYSLPSTVTIPAGQQGVTFTVPVNTSGYVAGSTYAIPLVITKTTAGTISGNFGAIIVQVTK